MTSNEWLGVIMQAEDTPKAMEKLIREYGIMLLQENESSLQSKYDKMVESLKNVGIANINGVKCVLIGNWQDIIEQAGGQ